MMNAQQQAYLDSLNAQAQSLQQQIQQFRLFAQTNEPPVPAAPIISTPPTPTNLAQLVDQAVNARLGTIGSGVPAAGSDASVAPIPPKMNSSQFGQLPAKHLSPEEMMFLMTHLDSIEGFVRSDDGAALLKLFAGEFRRYVGA
ncbi:hypothetical protein DIJ61_23665 [Burkholderia pseudomallei]|nr:hypothetical protein DIJ61_23665 [Burkholderia pseudomallei]